MSRHYEVRPSEILEDLFDLTGGDRFLVDEIAASDRVQKVVEDYLAKVQKGVKPKRAFQQQGKKGPPKPQFVKEKFYKGKKFSKWG